MLLKRNGAATSRGELIPQPVPRSGEVLSAKGRGPRRESLSAGGTKNQRRVQLAHPRCCGKKKAFAFKELRLPSWERDAWPASVLERVGAQRERESGPSLEAARRQKRRNRWKAGRPPAPPERAADLGGR